MFGVDAEGVLLVGEDALRGQVEDRGFGTDRRRRRGRPGGAAVAVRYRGGARLGLEVGVAPALERLDLAVVADDRLVQLRVALLVLLRAGGADERDQVVDGDVVERPPVGVGPHGHEALRIAADVAAADRKHVVDVLLAEVLEELHLIVQHRPDAAFAVDPVAARTVGLVEVVPALDGRDLLELVLGNLAGRAQAERQAELVEVVDEDEQGHDHEPQERDPAGVAGLPDDLRGALESSGPRWRASGAAR